MKSTFAFIRDFLLVPAVMLGEGISGRAGIQEARALDAGALKSIINLHFADGVTIGILFSTFYAVCQTIETLSEKDAWKKLSNKERCTFIALLLLAAAGFSYAAVQALLCETKTLLLGQTLPTVASQLFSAFANHGTRALIADRTVPEVAPTEVDERAPLRPQG